MIGEEMRRVVSLCAPQSLVTMSRNVRPRVLITSSNDSTCPDRSLARSLASVIEYMAAYVAAETSWHGPSRINSLLPGTAGPQDGNDTREEGTTTMIYLSQRARDVIN